MFGDPFVCPREPWKRAGSLIVLVFLRKRCIECFLDWKIVPVTNFHCLFFPLTRIRNIFSSPLGTSLSPHQPVYLKDNRAFISCPWIPKRYDLGLPLAFSLLDHLKHHASITKGGSFYPSMDNFSWTPNWQYQSYMITWFANITGGTTKSNLFIWNQTFP